MFAKNSLARSNELKLRIRLNQIRFNQAISSDVTAFFEIGRVFCATLMLASHVRVCIILSNPSGALMEREEKTIFQEHLKRAGLKRTTQRDLILDVFLDTEGHVSSEDLYSIIKAKDPSVGFTTVY